MIIVLDTSVLISAAILKGSINDLVVRKGFNEHEMIRSWAVTAELEATVRKKKFDKYFSNEYEREIFVHLFTEKSRLIKISHEVRVCRDPNDNMFLELALSGKAEAIISSDFDLLVLNPFENIPIISPKEFLEKF